VIACLGRWVRVLAGFFVSMSMRLAEEKDQCPIMTMLLLDIQLSEAVNLLSNPNTYFFLRGALAQKCAATAAFAEGNYSQN
jgi:hypothetical protein